MEHLAHLFRPNTEPKSTARANMTTRMGKWLCAAVLELPYATSSDGKTSSLVMKSCIAFVSA
jgi:hypothetical protein